MAQQEKTVSQSNLKLLAPRNSEPSARAAYQDLFLRSIDGIALLDISSGQILEANDTASRLLRKPLQEINGTSFYDFCHADFMEHLRKMLRIAIRRYHPKTFEITLMVGNPSVPISVELSAGPLKLNNQTEVLQVILRDITEKKESEEKIARYIQQIEEANKRLEELATTDGLTGLTNFREFSRLLEMEHTRSARYGLTYTIIFCDIDHFKNYNDKNGHPAGDALLKQFSQVVRACVRTTDIPIRYGGEEFVVLCPQTEISQAHVVAERIRSTFASSKFAHYEKQPMGFLSCSIGVAAFPKDGKTPAQILQTADSLLYQSKSEGRNRVSVSLTPAKTPADDAKGE